LRTMNRVRCLPLMDQQPADGEIAIAKIHALVVEALELADGARMTLVGIRLDQALHALAEGAPPVLADRPQLYGSFC
jgi:hypothetical protein